MKKKNVVRIAVLMICIGLFSGAWYVFDEIFPKAKPIRMPEAEDIVSVSVAVNTDDEFEIADVDLEELLQNLRSAKPTREQSMNDYPDKAFYRIEMQTADIVYRYFVYERGEQVYIEMPYEGIYTADDWLFHFVLKYFEE